MVNQIIDQYTNLPINHTAKWRLRHPEKNKESYTNQNKKQKESHRQWYLDNKENQTKRVRELKRKLRKDLIQLLGGKCIKCGFSDWRALEVDHVNGGGNKERASFKSYWSYYNHVLKSVQHGSKDYQCLCSNCNQIKEIEIENKEYGER